MGIQHHINRKQQSRSPAYNNNNIKRLLTAEIGVLLAFNIEDRAYV